MLIDLFDFQSLDGLCEEFWMLINIIAQVVHPLRPQLIEQKNKFFGVDLGEADRHVLKKIAITAFAVSEGVLGFNLIVNVGR